MTKCNITVRHLTLLGWLLLGFLGQPVVLAQNPFAVLAYVNQTPITAYDVEARIELLTATDQADPAKSSEASFRREVLADLIDEAIQLDQATRQGVLPGQEAIEESFSQLAARNDLSPEEFEDVLRTRNIDLRLFKSQLLPQLAWNAVLAANADTRLTITDEELDARWAEIQDQAGRNEWLLTEIYLDGVSQDDAEAAAELFRTTTNFADLILDISDSPSAAKGGDLGWIQEGRLGSAREAALRDLKPGDISDPISAEGGYFIYGVRATRPVGTSSVSAEVDLKRLTVLLTDEGESSEDQQRLGTLQTVLRQVNSCERFLQAAEIYGSQGSGDLGFVEPSTLPPLHADAVSQLKMGEISPLLPTEDGAVLYIVCDAIEITEPLTREEVRDQMVDERQQAFGEELMLIYRRQAYIEYL